jgi:hypothetical protein
VRTRGSKSRRKNKSPKSPDTRESLGKYRDFPFPKSDFPQRLSDFLQWLSAFLNGFPLSSTVFHFLNGFLLSSTAIRFLQRLSTFFNGFLLSSTAFRFLLWLSVEGGLQLMWLSG